MRTVAHALASYLAGCGVARPFDWRAWNCCHFVAGWLEYATGTEPMAGLPPTPSRTAAMRLVHQLGGSLVDVWTRLLGRPPIAPTLAQVGDVVRVPLPDGGEAIGLCNGRTAVCLHATGELVHVPVESATHAWRLRA